MNRPTVITFINNIKIIRVKESKMTIIIKEKLRNIFSIINIGLISFYLDLKAEHHYKQKIIKLFQLAYINQIIQKFYLDQTNPINIHIKKRNILFPNTIA